jgi:hypothetical protein
MNTIPIAVSAAVVSLLEKDRLRAASTSRQTAELTGRSARPHPRLSRSWFHRSTAPVPGA